MREMHDPENYLPPPSMHVEIAMAAKWSSRSKELIYSDLWLDIKDVLPKSMRDELDKHPEDYCYLTYED